MMRNEEETSRYFQAVTRFFLEHRGVPFFLSSKEIENIKEWKKMGIPLQVVREGIRDCFMAQRRRPGRKRKISSLVFCHPFVLRGYEAYKERKVGGKRKSFLRDDKRKELKKTVEKFLTACPEGFSGLRQVFARVLNLISQGADEELFEDLENELEVLVAGLVSEAEQELIHKEVMIEFASRNAQERDRIQQLKVIKHIREKYAIPHISLYYY